MLKSRKLLIGLICILVGPLAVLSLRASGWDPEDRYGMSEEAYERFVQEAERFGITPEQLKRMIDRELGHPLLYDRKRKFLVSYQSDADGSPTTIHIAPDPAGTESIGVKYDLAPEGGHSAFTYSGATSPESIADVIWRDLNTDGVFDQLLIVTDHNELLKLDRGAYILVEGRWVPAIREKGEIEHRMRRRDTDAVYSFNLDTGRWMAE